MGAQCFSYDLILSGLILSLVCSIGVIVLVGLICIVCVMFRLAPWSPTWEMAFHMAAADNVFDGD